MKKYLLPALLTLLFAIVYSYCFDSKLDINGDNATYIKLAENLSDGLGYSSVGVNGVEPASHFPPGYSMLLSVFVSLGMNNLVLFKVLNALFLLISLLLLYTVVSKLTENKLLGFSAIALTIFSPKLIDFASMAMSEMSYLLMAALVIYSAYNYSKQKCDCFLRSPYFYLAIVAAVASYYIRTVGASLFFSLLIFYAFRKEWKQLFVTAGGIVVLLLPWSIRNFIMGVESRYLGTVMTVNPWRPEEGSISSVGEMIQKMIHNFDETVIKSFKVLLFPFLDVNYQEPSTTGAVIVGLAILAVVFYGAWNFGKLRYFFLAFFVANIGLFMLWHGGNGSRYVIPIIPMIFICFWVGIYHLILQFKLVNERWIQQVPCLFLLLIIPMISPIKSLSEESREPYPPAFASYFKIAETISKEVPKNCVICCRKPELLGYYAKNVIAVNYRYSLEAKEVIQDLIDKKVEYVLLDNLGFSSTPRYLYPAIIENQDLFDVVIALRDPDTYLFRFNIEKAKEKLNDKTDIQR